MKKHLVVFLFFVLTTIVVTFPLIFHLDNRIIETGDGLLINWIINWNVHSFLGGPTSWVNIFNPNIFYPYKWTLAFSDYLFLQSFIALPFIALFKEPLLGFNINLLVGFILTGYSFYLLLFHLTKKVGIAILSGVLLTFSPIHLDFLVHQQLFSFWPVIFAWFFLIKKNYLWFVIFFILSSWSTALFVHFLVLITIVYFWKYPDQRKKIIIASGVALAVIFVFYLPYFIVSRQWHYVRPITDAIHFSLQIPDLFNPGPYSRLGNLSNFSSHYFGLGIIVLCLVAIKKKIKLINQGLIYVIVAISSFVLALGPALHIFRTTIHIGPIPAIPLPYTIFYYLIPGFSGFRTPSRWILLCVLALLLFLLVSLKNKLSGKFIVILALITFIEIPWPLKFQQVKSLSEFPPENIWLSQNYASNPVIYFPIYNWNDLTSPNWETQRMYFSTLDWHPMFNGYSGFTPEERQAQIKWLQNNFPSEEAFSYLKDLGIKLVIVPKEWAEKMSSFSQAEKLKEFPKTYVYQI